jgi:hypothetical protein
VVPSEKFASRAKVVCSRGNEERNKASVALLERRARETGESLALAGEFEVVQKVVVPSLRKVAGELEGIGLPRGKAYAAEAWWQTLRAAINELELKGMDAWRAEYLRPFRQRASALGLEYCIVN